MDFVAVMLYTQQVFNLQSFFFFWLFVILGIAIISNQISVWYIAAYTKKDVMFFCRFLNFKK